MQTIKEKYDIIEKTIKILEQPNYKKYSNNKANNYFEYFSDSFSDEISLIKPVLFPKFLEDVLGFKISENIFEELTYYGSRPDFVPFDKLAHSFVFDTKGTDTHNLRSHYKQIKNYIIVHNVKYGILVNMRNLNVFVNNYEKEIFDFSFSFFELFEDYKNNRNNILEQQNTQNFFNFIDKFKYKKIGKDEKIKILSGLQKWTGLEYLDIEGLIQTLKNIVNILIYDVEEQKNDLLDNIVSLDTMRKKKMEYEILNIMIDLGYKSGISEEPIDISIYFKNQDKNSITYQATNAFFYRVAYFSMTRILLSRVWGDIGFIDRNVLYNGDFKNFFEFVNFQISKVLEYAFKLSAEKYNWLFNKENNYTWYSPSDETILDILYELSNYPLYKLDHDILGNIYENYIDKVDKKNKGQYYTPHAIVNLIWNLVGYTKKENMWNYLYDNKNSKKIRKVKKVLDLATGSGSFLVEAIRRLKENGGINYDDFYDLLDLRTAILTGFWGSEITPFSYYITEVNLLIQLTPVIKRWLELKSSIKKDIPYSLAVIQNDSLQLYNSELKLTMDKTDEYKKDEHHDIIDKDDAKRKIFDNIKNSNDFEFCCMNPPYIGEPGNKELFRNTIRLYPFWKKYYQGKIDYLYWFIILGLSKLKKGGYLGFITTEYWLTADKANILRKYICKESILKAVIYFNEIKLFEHAKGQHNIVFIIEKGFQNNKNDFIKIVNVLNLVNDSLEYTTSHIFNNINKENFIDKNLEIYFSSVKNSDLNENPWNLKQNQNDNKILSLIESKSEFLSNLCYLNTGVSTGADSVDKDNIKLLSSETIESYNIKNYDGIFTLTENELFNLNLNNKEKEYIKPIYTNSEIQKYIINNNQLKYIIYLTSDINIDDIPNIKNHLLKFKNILDNRLEAKEGETKYYELYRPRKKSIFESNEKIVTPYRALNNTFAIDDQKYYSLKSVIIVNFKSTTKLSNRFILALLNSKLLDYWYLKKGKLKGKSREYFTTPLKKMPIYKINLNNSYESIIYKKVIYNTNLIMNSYKNFYKIAVYFKKYDFCNTNNNILNEYLIINSYTDKINIRQHPDISVFSVSNDLSDFILYSYNINQNTLFEDKFVILKSKNKKNIKLKFKNEKLLNIILLILDEFKDNSWEVIKEKCYLPLNIEKYENYKLSLKENAQKYINSINSLQNEIDKIIFDLYGINNEDRDFIINSIQ